MFGYCTDENGFFIENEEQSKVVRYIFSEYANSAKSTAKIAQEVQELKLVKQYSQKNRLAYRISTLKEREKNAVEAWEELEERYFLQRTASKSKYEELSSKLQLEVNEIRNEIQRAEAELKSLQNVEVQDVDLYSMTDEARQEMVRKYVGSIIFRKLDKWQAWLSIEFIRPFSVGYSLTYNRKDKTFTTYFEGEPVTTPIKIIRNIKGRKRDYSNRNKNGKLLDVQG